MILRLFKWEHCCVLMIFGVSLLMVILSSKDGSYKCLTNVVEREQKKRTINLLALFRKAQMMWYFQRYRVQSLWRRNGTLSSLVIRVCWKWSMSSCRIWEGISRIWKWKTVKPWMDLWLKSWVFLINWDSTKNIFQTRKWSRNSFDVFQINLKSLLYPYKSSKAQVKWKLINWLVHWLLTNPRFKVWW